MSAVRVRRYNIWILLVVLLAFGLRLYALDRQDIWGDEAFSIWLSSQPLDEVVAGGSDTHPPLYPFLLYLWQRLTGTSPLAVRLLSALVGTLVAPIVYVLGKQATRHMASGSRGVPFLAPLLTAVSPILVHYAQETRVSGLVTLLAAASIYWALRFVHKPRSLTVALATWFTSLAAAYTHYYTFFVLLAENRVLLPAVWHRLGRQGWGGLGRWLAVRSGWAWAIATIFGLALGAGLVLALTRRRPEGMLVAATLLLPLLLAWVVNPIMPFSHPRYLLLALAFYLLVAWGVAALRQLWAPLGPSPGWYYWPRAAWAWQAIMATNHTSRLATAR